MSARARTAAGKEKNFNKVPRWGVAAGYPVALPCGLTTTDGKRDRIVSLMADGLVAHPKRSTSVRSDEGYTGAAENFIEDFVVPTTAEDTMDSATAVENSIINGYSTEDLVNSGLELQPANAEGSKEAEAARRTGCRPTAPSQSTADSLGTVLLHAVATKASNRREVAVGLKAGCLTQGSKGAPTGGRPMRGRAKMAPPLPTLWE